MSYEEQVYAATSPKEAMHILAIGVDAILAELRRPTLDDGWGTWEQSPSLIDFDGAFGHKPIEVPDPPDHRTEITGDTEHTEIAVPSVSPEKQERRRKFEQDSLHLAEYLGDGDDWTSAYGRGGPRWLYYGNRDLVASYPYDIKAQMVADIFEDSPEEAHEIARDLLKVMESGPGHSAPIADGDVG